MTYQPFVEFIEALALQAGAASFWHGKQAEQDINYDEPFPQVHLFLLPSTLKGAGVTYRLTMCFYGKDEHENGGPQTLPIQDAMDRLSQQFAGLLAQADEVEVGERGFDRAPVARKGSGIGTGFVIAFELTTESEAVC
jgi:hypothetical protein